MSETRFPIEPGSIAIVGIAGRFPSAATPAELWQLLRDGREATQWLSDDELRAAGVPDADLADPNYVKASLVLPDMEMFDADFFGFSKKDAAVLDPQHRHFLECCWEALEDAGHVPGRFEGSIGVFGGCGMQAYFANNLLTNPQLVKSMGLFLLRHTGNDKDFLCTRASYLLDLKGPSLSVQTACSTSLVAVHVAAQSLLSGECDMALAGGVSIELPHRQGYRYAEGEILSPDGHCRAFDDSAEGTIFGSGAAVVVLRRLEDAVRNGDHVYAVIRGSAVNNDGYGKAGYLAPSVDGQASAAAEALAVAGVDPASVSYIEAHGTGTPVGDPIEVAALSQAYGAGGKGFCGIGSIKTNIGHLDTAAGAASLIKVVQAMRHGLIPSTLNFSRANTRMKIEETPFQVVAQPRPWPSSSAPRRAAVNSLGVGGTNAHVIVEESPIVLPSRTSADVPQVFAFSARTPESLGALRAKWHAFLAEPPPDFDFANAAYTLQVGRREFEHRFAAVAQDTGQLRNVLQAKAHVRSVASKAGSEAPRVVFMFPGGGAHYPGAGRELLAQAAFAQAVDECFAELPGDAPQDLRDAMFERDAQDKTLQRPRYAIPALFILEYAIAKLWASWGVTPSAVIGHSAGEYAAACLAGAMSLRDALAIVTLRGQLFEEAPAGAMLSVDLPEQELRAAIEDLPLDVAAINAPDLSIASGSLDAIAQLETRLAQRAVEFRRLHIDVAAHSRLLDGVLGAFRERVSAMNFAAPQLPFISNVTGGWADPALIADPEYWVRHLRQPVRFADGLALLREMPDAVLVEVGPGQGLSALARQNQLGAQRMIVASTPKAQEAGGDLALMLTSAGALWTRGVAVEWKALRGGGERRRIPLPTYAFDRQRYWIEPGVRSAEAAPAPAPARAKTAALDRIPTLDDWFRVPQWIEAPIPAPPAVAGEEPWLVFGTDSHLTDQVVAQSLAQGARVTLVRRGEEFAQHRGGSFTVAPSQPDHFVRLLQALEAEGHVPRRVIHLWALDTLPGAVHETSVDRSLSFDSLVHFARAVQEQGLDGAMHVSIITAGTFAARNGEPVPHAERALALGSARVIPRELPNVTTRLVDFAHTDLSAAAIVREAQQAQGPDLVAWRGGERLAQQLAPAAGSAPRKQPLVREGGVYLITGGLGEIALELAGWLAREKRARLALVSRRALPPRASWPALAASGDHSPQVRLVRRLLAIEALGARVLPLEGDVADRRAMTRAVAECRARFGTINGVFHAAGVLDDAPIAAKTPESIARVIGAKAAGAQVLHELLPPGDLDVFAVFSSTSVLLGAAGQVDYVAANAFLDSLAASRDDGVTIRWGIWGDRGMAARAYGHHAAPETVQASHPLLGAQVGSEDGAQFEASYDSTRLWVLREHRIGVRAVLPGTAYIEIARAAMMALHPRAAIEIRSLSFEEAMVFEPGEARIVRTELRRNGNGYDFTVRSRAARDGEWLEHARASASVFLGELSHAPAAAPTGWQPGVIPQEKAVAFGERWHNLARMQLGTGRAFAHLELAPSFHDDAQVYAMHPALTDMAATFGLHLLDANRRQGQLFVPLSIDRIRIAGPLPPRIASCARLRSAASERLATFDVQLSTETGKPLASFEGFSLRPVQPDAVSGPGGGREPGLTDTMLACGIRAEDAPALFERILLRGARDLVVSSIDLAQLARAMAPAPRPAARPKPAASTQAATALNPVESALAEVWRELLGVEEVAPDDDFFALGGHSLAAVRLFARVRKQYHVDLPLATLFQAPTLGALAAMVAQQANIPLATNEPQRKSNVIPLPPRAWSPLVTICKGEPQRLPLFCVHGAGGNVLNFKVISDRLGAQQPFYGLQAQGVDGRLQPLKSIEEMAEQYVEAIRSVDPRGPYQLAGYSAGGVIALEMAQRLKRAGAQVQLLAMIDTLEPVAARSAVPAWKKLWLLRHWSMQFMLERPERRRRGREAAAEYAAALQRLALGEPLPAEMLEHHLFNNFVEAQSRYTPQAYEGDVVLFRAVQAETQYLAAGATLGWSGFVRGAIRVHEVPGSHFSMMSEPGVSQLVEGLRVELGLTERPAEAGRGSFIDTIAAAIGLGRQRPA